MRAKVMRLLRRTAGRWLADLDPMTLLDHCFAHVYTSRLAPAAYLLTAPVAEVYFFFLVQRFIDRRRSAAHSTYCMFTDAADALRFWETQLKESPATLKSILRGWFSPPPEETDLQMCRDNVAEFLMCAHARRRCLI